MAERPILFSAPMVRAILDGSKTQTRRVVKPKKLPDGHWMVETRGTRHELTHWDNDTAESNPIQCPYGQPGDRLWVRETYMPDPPDDGTWAGTSWRGCKGALLEDIPERFRSAAHCLHRASWSGTDLVGWKPSIHMPRWASRITLEITGVRVERLQDISRDDAKAEGCHHDDPCDHKRRACEDIGCEGPDYRVGFRNLWESINGPDSWAVNPWVWVVEFRRIDQ